MFQRVPTSFSELLPQPPTSARELALSRNNSLQLKPQPPTSARELALSRNNLVGANCYETKRAQASSYEERWGAGVETQKYVRGEIEGWGRVPFNETYAPSLSTIYDGA